MVQHEVKKKTRVYGTVAVLAAMVLVSLIYVFGGSTPGVVPGTNPNTNPNGTPNTNPNTNPSTNPSTDPTINPAVTTMKSFASYEELRNYLTTNSKGTSTYYAGGPLDSKAFGGDSRAAAEGLSPAPAQVPSFTIGTADTTDYSTTNIQVAGVDEADTTKNDGSYIYTISTDTTTGKQYICIVKAAPSDPRVIAKIPMENNTYLAGMFLSQDGSKLVAIGSQYQFYAYPAEDLRAMPSVGMMIYPYYSDVKSFINVYDIADKVHPVLARNFTLTGSYFNSRMIGDYVYTVVSQSAYVLENNVPLPTIYTTEGSAEVPATRVYYSDVADYSHVESNYFTFTSFYGLNLKDSSQQLTNMTVLMGGASTMYVSVGNMYVTYPSWSNGQYTSVYRVSIDKGTLTFQAKGSVPGNVLNQYSMDEFNGYFRLATTSWQETTVQNIIHVLDMNLTAVGKLVLPNSEVRETIQSARFIGNKAYVVTFEQKDPFFVIDMSNPTAPKMAGKLEIPGYSSYLHPYDDNHIIGLGIENRTVKLSLFDVTNVNAPTEIAKYIVQGDYTYSQAMYEPKAFLFDKARELLVIPISVSNYGVIDSTGKELSTGGGFWEGVYVFRVTLAGFQKRGEIAHQQPSTGMPTYIDYNSAISRSLYIGNTLYTVSTAKVKLNSLTDLSPIAEVRLF